jgi:hypothetical protein
VSQPSDALWHFTEALAASLDEELKQTSSQISIERAIKPFLGHFIMTCMSLEKHTLVNFLLTQDDTLIHRPIQNRSTRLPDDKPPESQASKKHQFKRRASFWGLPQAYEEGREVSSVELKIDPI